MTKKMGNLLKWLIICNCFIMAADIRKGWNTPQPEKEEQARKELNVNRAIYGLGASDLCKVVKSIDHSQHMLQVWDNARSLLPKKADISRIRTIENMFDGRVIVKFSDNTEVRGFFPKTKPNYPGSESLRMIGKKDTFLYKSLPVFYYDQIRPVLMSNQGVYFYPDEAVEGDSKFTTCYFDRYVSKGPYADEHFKLQRQPNGATKLSIHGASGSLTAELKSGDIKKATKVYSLDEKADTFEELVESRDLWLPPLVREWNYYSASRDKFKALALLDGESGQKFGEKSPEVIGWTIPDLIGSGRFHDKTKKGRWILPELKKTTSVNTQQTNFKREGRS